MTLFGGLSMADDDAWFAQHPGRRWRMRYAMIGEHRPPEEVFRGIWNLSYTVVYRSRSGRVRKWPLYVSLFG
jgi:hypothetical protein